MYCTNEVRSFVRSCVCSWIVSLFFRTDNKYLIIGMDGCCRRCCWQNAREIIPLLTPHWEERERGCNTVAYFLINTTVDLVNKTKTANSNIIMAFAASSCRTMCCMKVGKMSSIVSKKAAYVRMSDAICAYEHLRWLQWKPLPPSCALQRQMVRSFGPMVVAAVVTHQATTRDGHSSAGILSWFFLFEFTILV